MDIFNYVLESINKQLSVYLLIPLLILAGVYFSFRTKFVQFRLFKDAFKTLMQKSEKGKVSSFQSLMISMASRIGVGHIAGITFAIVIGGPGAIFWMWLMAIFGSASAFIESTLAQIYKIKVENGNFRGGPSYYIQKVLNKKWLGILFSCLLTAGYAYGFNMLQSYQLSSSLEYYVPNYRHTVYPIIVGTILAVVVGLVIWGGTHRIAFVSKYIVPVMSITYMLLAIVITIKNFDKVPGMLALIFKEAFSIRSLLAVPFYRSALLNGIKKGLFSNEAGMGSAPNAAATADVPHPVNQGLAQVISVFIDTMLICSATAFIVLLSGVKLNEAASQVFIVQQAARMQVGPIGAHVILFAVFSFAFASIIGNYCYAEANVLFIKNDKKVLNIFRATCVLAVFLGAQAGASTVWNFSDIFMALMATVNITVILLIGGIAIKAMDDYTRQKKLRKIPVFKAKSIGLNNTEVWK